MAAKSKTKAHFFYPTLLSVSQCLVLHMTHSWHLVNFLMNEHTSNQKTYPHKDAKIGPVFIHRLNKHLFAGFTKIEG